MRLCSYECLGSKSGVSRLVQGTMCANGRYFQKIRSKLITGFGVYLVKRLCVVCVPGDIVVVFHACRAGKEAQQHKYKNIAQQQY